MHFFYIIYSKKADKYYVGESPDVQNRLRQHNAHYFKKGFTNIADDWAIVLSKKCNDQEQAIFLERFVKRMKSRKFIEKVCNDPSILDGILSKR